MQLAFGANDLYQIIPVHSQPLAAQTLTRWHLHEKAPKAPGKPKAEEVAPSNHQLLGGSPYPNMHKSIWALPPSTGCRLNPATLLPAKPFLQLLGLLFLCQTGNRP